MTGGFQRVGFALHKAVFATRVSTQGLPIEDGPTFVSDQVSRR